MFFIKKNFWHLLFLLVLIGVSIFLFIRNADETRWSPWSPVPELQTIRYWMRDGILEHKILLVLQGYSKVTRYYDSEPELNEHARSVVPNSSRFPGAGRLLHYTHSPVGFFIPYFILAKLGVDASEHRTFAGLSIVFSLLGLVLMYLFFAFLTGPKIAFLTTTFYLTSDAFLSYSDSFSTPPINDFITYVFLVLIVLEAKKPQNKIWTVLAWFSYFMLSLIALDSFLFVFIFLIGWDLLNKKGLKIKRWFVFGLAFVIARIIQFAQNVWYLGFSGMIKDTFDTIYLRSASFGMSGGVPFGKVYKSLWRDFIRVAPTFPKGTVIQLILFLFIIGGLYYLYIKRDKIKTVRGYSYFWLLATFAVGGSAYVFLFPSAGGAAYQVRQFVPFFGLFVAFITLHVFCKIKKFRIKRNKRELASLLLFCPLFLMLWTGSITKSASRLNFRIWDQGLSKNEFNFANSLAKITAGNGGVVFMISDYYPHDIPERNRLSPLFLIEYYADASILPFARQDNLIRDLKLLLRISEFPFIPILVTDTKDEIREIVTELVRDEFITSEEEVMDEVKKIEDWEVVNLAPFVNIRTLEH